MVYNAIALSGHPKSGKTTLIQKISEETGWKRHSIGDLLRERHKTWQEVHLKEVCFEDYFKDIVTDRDIIRINNLARELLRMGNIVLDSRYAAMNAKGLRNVLLVFLETPLKKRAQRAFDSNAYPGSRSPDEVARILEQREKDEIERGISIYKFNYRGNGNYSENGILNLDSSRLAIGQELRLVLERLKS